MIGMKSILTFLILIIAFWFVASGQEYFFRQYSNEEGLQHSFIYSINQDDDGYLWIGTGEGLYRFNGLDFEYFTTKDGLADNFITEIFRDKGGILWIGHQNGSISALSGNDFVVVTKSIDAQGSVTDITEDDQGIIWASVQNQGLISITEDQKGIPVSFSIEHEPLSQIEYLGNDNFLIGSQESLYLSKYQNDTDSMVVFNRIEAYPGSRVVDIFPESPGNYIIVSQDEGIYYFEFDSLSADYSFSTIDDNTDGVLDNIQGGILDGDGVLWLNSMGNGLIQYRGKGKDFTSVGIVSTVNGLISDNVRSAFEDTEGNLWLGLYGEGLLRYVDNNLKFYHYNPGNESNKTYTITGDNGGLYVVVGNRLLRLNRSGDKVLISTPLPGNNTGDVVNAAYLANDGRLWLGFEKSGLFVFGPSGFKAVFISNDDLANSVNHITGNDGYIWVSTKKGICGISAKSGNTKWYTTDHGLPHNNIQQLYIDSKSRVLVATLCSEIHYVSDNGEIDRLEHSKMESLNSVMSISEDGSGTIWAGTQGNGLWKILEGDNINYTHDSGLISDFCYSLAHTEQGVIIVGHRGGISQIDPKTNRIRTFSQLEGINSSAELYPNAIFTDNFGSIWFGTSDGLVKYTSTLSGGGTAAPRLQISALYVSGEEVDLSAGQVLLKPGYYELAVEYTGIHLTNPEMVIYQTKLEGYNISWSGRTPDRRVVYDRVGHGKYTFRIRAFNESNIGSEIASGFELRIKKPIYLTRWFYAAFIVVLSFLVYMIIRLRERNQIRFQISLQKQLDERTQEVIIQKEEIEIKNNDITDSINYAQKIQASILPPVSKLQGKFAGAFVFYQPRDIVSGDFYWYDEFGNDQFIIVCADSTGHGVPGAFMSMIGTTMIKDIYGKENVDSPSKILSRLDKEIRTVLSQNLEEGGSNDGMDIIIAEINLRSRQLSTASAMRPMIIYQGGEPIYVSGNRLSIGGQYEFGEKTFDTHEHKLNKGDKLYMYTDGYADQFGGPYGKKFKTSNLKKLLQDIHEKPMDEQYNHIKDSFELWKGDMSQVDDVLIMGIEI